MTKTKRFIAFIMFICSSTLLLRALPVFAQTQTGTFSVSPDSAIITQNNTQTYTVSLNAGSTKIYGADAVITYPKDLVEAKNITNGGFFSADDFTFAVDSTNGRIELHGFIFTADGKSGSGTFATFQLLGRAGSGTGELTFRCAGANPTSKILDEDGTNIINCSALPTANISITGGGPTPTPTATPMPTATQAPQQSGNADPSCSGLTVTPNTGKSPLTTTLICTGNDTDGDITAAEFAFGDGRVKLISQNVGSFGSVSTQATYGNSGSYAVTCRVRDNNNRFSGIPDACRKMVDVSAGTVSSGTRPRAIVSAAKPLPKSDEPQIVDLTPYRPTEMPTPIPTIAPGETEEPVVKEKQSPSRTLLGIGVIMSGLLLGGFLILKSRKHPFPPPPPTPPVASQTPS